MDVFLHSIGSALPPSQTKKSPAGDGPETNRSGSTVLSDDSVEASLNLRTLNESVMSAPVVNQDHVSRIASAIASGHYEIDAQNAAKKLVELEFLTP